MFTFHVCVSIGCYLCICAITKAFVVKSKRCSFCNGLFCGPGVHRNTAAILETVSCCARQFWKITWSFWSCNYTRNANCFDARNSGLTYMLRILFPEFVPRYIWPGYRTASCSGGFPAVARERLALIQLVGYRPGGFGFQAAASLSLLWQQLPGAEILIVLPLVWHW